MIKMTFAMKIMKKMVYFYCLQTFFLNDSYCADVMFSSCWSVWFDIQMLMSGQTQWLYWL